MKEMICSQSAPEAIGPYSQGIICGELLFLSGQTPIDPESNKIESTSVKGQASRVIQNIKSILHADGLVLDDIIKTTVYLTDMADFNSFNSIYEEYFSEPFPARSVVAVAGLPKGALVEIEVIAKRNIK